MVALHFKTRSRRGENKEEEEEEKEEEEEEGEGGIKIIALTSATTLWQDNSQVGWLPGI